MRRRQGGFGIILMMIALIIFASGAIVVYTVFMKPERMTEVPSFVGKSIVDAVSEAESLELVVQIEQVASTMPDGRVLAQAPDPGTALRKGKVVVLQVSRGGEKHPVPNVAGKSLADAQEIIKSQGFALGDVVKIRESGVEAGSVIAQSPGFPAEIASGRKIDLLVQDMADASGNVTVPDVNRMNEKEARNVLEAAGVKVQAVDRVYSPLLPEGLAIETRPGAGSLIKSGQGVILKIATLRRPAGFMDADSNNPNVRRVTSGKGSDQTQTQPQTQATQAQTPPAKPATPSPAPDKPDTPTAPPVRTQTQAKPSTPSPSPAPAKPAATGAKKTARIRYVVPPIARPMQLRIEVTDPSGKRNVLSRQVRSGETISTTASYTQECMITIYLGGESVWQERQN